MADVEYENAQPPKVADPRVEAAARALEDEVQKRNEWYGLDNWTMQEVARFVLAAADPVDPHRERYRDALLAITSDTTNDPQTIKDIAREALGENA